MCHHTTDNYIFQKPKMIELLHSSIFEDIRYDVYVSREQYDVTHEDICNFIEECVKILVKKQQLKKVI